ncbi:VanZ family protein [Bacillus sp. EAC]|uniref:VanZ family protein n=1 Tax=Bacillus sp. EAC TaxID=1978338 RepID=UPI000B442ABB|nr:VanZ family protein [Bacillus sp. EAC]
MKKIIYKIFILLLSTLIVFFLMREILGELLSRLIPYANSVFGYSVFVCLILILNTIINVFIYYKKNKKIYISKFGFAVFTISYILLLVSVLFSRNSLGNHYRNNYTPLKTIWGYLNSNADFIYIFSNLIGNIVIFIPLGSVIFYFLHKYMRDSMCIFISIFIVNLLELIQTNYIVGSFDIDDILLNSLGVFLGIKILAK